MARRIKIDNAYLKRFRQKKNLEKRAVGTREQRYYFLIASEGAKTEPNYFRALKEELQKGVVEIEIFGAGANTTSLIAKTEKYAHNLGRKFDEIWVVFDKDAFTAENFNDAIFSAQQKGFKVAYSNEAFELWYLLHFEYCNTGINRTQYCTKLSKWLGIPYQKGDDNIYQLLQEKGNEQQAIRWAEMLYELYDHQNPANEIPSTTVHMLVKKLNNYKQLDK